MPEVVELELTRSRDDRRRYDIAGVGSIRLTGFFSRRATAEAGGTTWAFDRRTAHDAAGTQVGAFDPRVIRGGGRLRWGDREYLLRRSSVWQERYALADGDRELALLEGKGWGRRPVRITLDDPAAVEPGLLLFAAYLVRRLAEDASGAAGATVATTTAPIS